MKKVVLSAAVGFVFAFAVGFASASATAAPAPEAQVGERCTSNYDCRGTCFGDDGICYNRSCHCP